MQKIPIDQVFDESTWLDYQRLCIAAVSEDLQRPLAYEETNVILFQDVSCIYFVYYLLMFSILSRAAFVILAKIW